MSVTISGVGRVITARLTGEIDTYTSPDVRAAFDHLAVPPDGLVVVDLREVTFIDSSGIGAVVGLYHRTTQEGGRLRVVCADATLRLFRLMHLDQVFDVVTGLEEGPAEVDQPPREPGAKASA